MSQKLIIRRADSADAEKIADGINQICVEGGAFYVTRFVLSEKWHQLLYQPKTNSNHLSLVAEWDQQFAGSLRLFTGEEYTLYEHVSDLGLFILKPYRRLGIGTRLMTEALGWARINKVEKIMLVVFASNLLAIRLYERFGFQQEGCLKRQIKTGNEYIDLLQMALFL
ncbi:MAG: GNAT family N-acetyltransferase [Chloroflexi bacterium]|nr:GNAT family N-acetyltransferase [Chloroflexota bacterium]